MCMAASGASQDSSSLIHTTDGSVVVRPAPGVTFSGLQVSLEAHGQNRAVGTRVALRGRDVTDAAVPMFEVVPVREVGGPGARLKQIGESARGELQSFLLVVERIREIAVVHGNPDTRDL